MTSFRDLPNELIAEVWGHIRDPRAIEAFALTATNIYVLGSAAIAEHNKLRVQYMSINFGFNGTGDDAAEMLQRLLLDPRAAVYVQRITIDRRQDPVNDPTDPRYREYSEEIMELFRQSIKDSPLISEDRVDHWLKCLETREKGVIESLVLSLLPNVHTLHMYRTESHFYDMIDCISNSRGTEILSRLVDVRLLPGDSHAEEEFDWVRLFATLPSVWKIEAWDINREGEFCTCGGRDGLHDRDCDGDCYGASQGVDCNHLDCYWRRSILPPKTSAVKHLALINCHVNTKRLHSFLEGLQALETFNYVRDGSFWNSSEPEEVVDALREHNTSLQLLRLRSTEGDRSYAVSLADFGLLKQVDIDYGLLLFVRNWTPHEGLVNLLPPSIEKVRLNALYSFCQYQMKRNVLDMVIGKAERLPNLRELTIELSQIDEDVFPEMKLDPDTIPQMKRKCEDVGVRLDVTIQAV